jgi:hypothetical protein
MRIVTSIAAVLMLAPGGCGAAVERPRAPAPGRSGVGSRTLGPAAAVVLAALPALGRLTATCRHGVPRVGFSAAGATASETVGVTAGRASRSAVLDPGERLAGPVVRGVETWQVSAISEGRVRVATAWVSGHRMPGGPACFVTVRTDVASRPR